MSTTIQRGDQVVGELLQRINALIAEADVTYDEYQAAKQWLIDVGEAGEWPLLLDVFVEHAVEAQATRRRDGSEGSILGPYHLPDHPFLEPPFELPQRPDERGESLWISGRVTSADGRPLPGAVLDLWHADADGLYSGFSELPAGLLRGKVRADEEGRFAVRTIKPAPYTIPHAGPTGRLIAVCGWHPWRPAHVHLLVTAEGHEPLVTQLYLDDSEYLDGDIAGAVKPSLVVHPQPVGDHLEFEYEFRLAPAPSAAA
ncbi:Protocatechuate 34-dioxygenase beta subunit [Patulibacter medicamentivorans]|uniref:Protocatechuate 34-dioxygenase beta subunit n=1 Tax=Patulibacter medicamentivorans TaxID=1097667 RepID=H0E810_9ACTN|nr:dioxygenase [Patulibacter medicamentivorans]EHN10208.1 Protocatechuate 34-dioxygenase beta subunit [Patulibacter medicamentivorans]